MALLDKMRKTATEFVEKAMEEEQEPWRRDERMPFAGFQMDRNGDATCLAPSGPHLLVLAGTGAGKSRRILVPQIITWDGPVCAVSAKGDLAEMSGLHRARRGGPMYIMDLTGQVDQSALPEGIIPVVNDPCALLVPDADGLTDDSALDLANLLLQVGTLSMNATGGGGGDSGFWMTLAVRSLAALLQAGAGYPDPVTGEWVHGGGIDWVLKAAIDYGLDDEEPSDEIDLDTPNWTVAELRAAAAGSAHADELAATRMLDPKQRDSVGINLRVALSSWQKRAVRGKPGDVPFSPTLLEDPNATFYLVSPLSGSAAGAATSVIESLVEHWTVHATNRGLPKIAMVIDECTQICPIPRLGEHIGLMRSYGMHFTVATQSSYQFAEKFGELKMKVLLNVFPAILVGIGANEKDLLELAAWTQPASERRVDSNDSRGQQSNLGSDRIDTYTGAELLPRHQGEGRLLLRGRAGMRVKLVDYTEM